MQYSTLRNLLKANTRSQSDTRLDISINEGDTLLVQSFLVHSYFSSSPALHQTSAVPSWLGESNLTFNRIERAGMDKRLRHSI